MSDRPPSNERARAAATLGAQAAQVLENPAFVEAFKRVHTKLVDEWADLPIDAIEQQQLTLQAVKALRFVEVSLQAMIRGGEAAAMDLQSEIDKRKADIEPTARVRQLRRSML